MGSEMCIRDSYIIRGTTITEHGSSDGPLVSDTLPAVVVEQSVLTPEDQ